jgi:hypothetical protein
VTAATPSPSQLQRTGGGEGPIPAGSGGSGETAPLYQLGDVSLIVTTETGDHLIPGLALSISREGIAILKATGQLVKVVPWDLIQAVEFDRDDEGGELWEMTLETEVKVHRFRLSSGQADLPARVEAALQALGVQAMQQRSLLEPIARSARVLVSLGALAVLVVLLILHASGHLSAT